MMRAGSDASNVKCHMGTETPEIREAITVKTSLPRMRSDSGSFPEDARESQDVTAILPSK